MVYTAAYKNSVWSRTGDTTHNLYWFLNSRNDDLNISLLKLPRQCEKPLELGVGAGTHCPLLTLRLQLGRSQGQQAGSVAACLLCGWTAVEAKPKRCPHIIPYPSFRDLFKSCPCSPVFETWRFPLMIWIPYAQCSYQWPREMGSHPNIREQLLPHSPSMVINVILTWTKTNTMGQIGCVR